MVTEFRHSMEMARAISGYNQLKWMVSWGPAWSFLPSRDALVFIDNHDSQRSDGSNVITYKQPRKYKMAVAFMLAHPYGLPRIMSSFNFTDSSQGKWSIREIDLARLYLLLFHNYNPGSSNCSF